MLPQTNENVFSRDNLKEVAEISEHIVFSEQMLEKYDWSDETEENFKRLIDNIKRKNADDKFNLSIVGEFSTGKSSFINALLKTPLMAAQMLQGTTVAATSIEYSDEYKVKTILNSGEERTVVASDLSQLKNVIDTYTTETDTAKDLHSVYVYLPAGDFSKKIRIIDTPGTNVEKMWHESVTVRAIEEISDASVVLIDATKVLPQSLTRFVNANLSNVISRCIFVVTKIDLIPPNERKRVLDYVKVKVKQEFEIEKPIVVGYSSVAALDEQNELYPMCMESEKVIFETIRLKSVLIQVEKLLSLTDKMYSEMDEEINLVKTVYEQELTLIERSKNVDLNDFIRSEKEDRKKQFRRSMNMLALELETVLNYMEYDERECIKAELDDIANLDTLKNYVDVVLVDRVKKTAEKLCSFTQGCFSGINGGFGEEINVFQEHFKKEFEKLDVLQIDDNLIREEMNKSTSVDSAQLGNVENYVNDLVFKENMKKFGGAAAGAAIGSMIAPGIGTVIGGVIGLMSGGGNVEKAKLQVKEQVDNIFRTDIMKIIANAVGMFKNIIGKKENSIETEINKYMECYRSYVIETENEFIKRKTIVQKKIDDVNKDLSEISMRKFRLDSVAQNIKQLD